MRTYKRKTERGSRDKNSLEDACKQVLDGKSIRSVSLDMEIPYKTLYRYVQTMKKQKDEYPETPCADLSLEKVGYVNNRQIFSVDEEKTLVDHFKTTLDIYIGMSTFQVRKLAYGFCQKLKKNAPGSWVANKGAGEDWLALFLKRNPNLSIWKPQAAGLSALNKRNVDIFVANLKNLYGRLRLHPSDIWNMNETVINVSDAAKHGMNNLETDTSDKKEDLVTIAVTVSAEGNAMPPFIVFPRSNETASSANPSEWMKEDQFIDFANYFILHAKPTEEKSVLLLLDNHKSFFSVDALHILKKSGVTVLTLPPHYRQKLQPLEMTVFRPLKEYFTEACRNWKTSYPGRQLSIFDISACLKTTFPLAATVAEIQSGFHRSGIYPLNEETFAALERYITGRSASVVPDVPDKRGNAEEPTIIEPEANYIDLPEDTSDFIDVTTISEKPCLLDVRPLPKDNHCIVKPLPIKIHKPIAIHLDRNDDDMYQMCVRMFAIAKDDIRDKRGDEEEEIIVD